jgi:predicted O-methyltransferase YrrM
MKSSKLLKEIEKNKISQLHSAEKEVVDFIIALISITSSKSILEIGTHLGYTSFGILLSLQHVNITSVDFAENYKPYLAKLPRSAKSRLTLVHLPAGEFYSK